MFFLCLFVEKKYGLLMLFFLSLSLPLTDCSQRCLIKEIQTEEMITASKKQHNKENPEELLKLFVIVPSYSKVTRKHRKQHGGTCAENVSGSHYLLKEMESILIKSINNFPVLYFDAPTYPSHWRLKVLLGKKLQICIRLSIHQYNRNYGTDFVGKSFDF